MSGIYKDDDWSLSKAQINGVPLIIRTRSRMPALPDREIYDKLVIITWPYAENESGMPLTDERQAMYRLEDAIEQSIEPSGLAVQAVSMTGNGKKEWRYYTYDTDEFMAKLNKELAGHPAYPIDIQTFEDSNWEALSEWIVK
jgi:hypothetical protein